MNGNGASKRLFGTNGVRGIAGADMTPDLALRIGFALGSMRRGRIAVGRDTRTSGEMLENAVTAGLLAAGCDVTACGILPTPALQYIIRGEYAGGVMVTASHNPPEYNGIKVIDADGTELSDAETQKLEGMLTMGIPAVQPWTGVGRRTPAPDLFRTYIEAVAAQFPGSPGAGMLVVADPGSGPACRTTPEILRRVGCRVLTVNGTMDGRFFGRLPEPSQEGLFALSRLVVSANAAFGVAHDGDADRAVFVDEKGCFVEENAEFALVARHCCRGKNGMIITPVSTSQVVESVARGEGCGVLYTKVGSITVARTMLSLMREGKPVILGGENNGGLIYPGHQFCRDGGMSAAMMVAILERGGKPLSELVAGLPRRYMIKGKIPSENAGSVIAGLARQFPGDTIDRLDGVKILRGASWALVRASGTEPLIRVIAESADEEQASAFYREVIAALSRSVDQ